MRSLLLLPPAAKRLIQLYRRQIFIQLRLHQLQLSIKRIRLVREHFQIPRHAAVVPHVRKTRRILRRREQQFLLLPKLLRLPPCNQRIRNALKRALNRLLIRQQKLLPLRLDRKSVV